MTGAIVYAQPYDIPTSPRVQTLRSTRFGLIGEVRYRHFSISLRIALGPVSDI